MKRKLLAGLSLLAAVLSALPWSAVLRYAAKGETRVQYFSSFDPTPFVNRNFGPLFTAVTAVVLLVTALIYLFGKKGPGAVRTVSGAGFLFSLLPLFSPAEHFTWLGGAVSLLFLGITVLAFLPLPDGGGDGGSAGRKKRKKKK